mgnify:CR=1 FL=1
MSTEKKAEAIAGGHLETRLGAADDPDLGVLVASFNHMAQVLEERIEQDNRFASDVSHELRSPLMTLSASIEVLASRREEMPDALAMMSVSETGTSPRDTNFTSPVKAIFTSAVLLEL